MQHRRLMILFALISIFAFGVILWYFLFSKPDPAPTLDETVSPFSLRDLPARFGFISNTEPPETTTETEVTPPGQEPFIRVSNKPSTGNVFVSRPVLQEIIATSTVGTTTVSTTRTVRATTTVLMFVDRITGHVYGHTVATGKTYQISNTTIPGIYDAYIWSAGDRVVMRHLASDRKTIVTVSATIPNVQEGRDPQPLSGITYLPQNTSSIAVNPTLTSVSYLVPNEAGSSIYTMTASGIAKVLDSPFSSWILSYGGNQLYMTSKASAYIQGSTFAIPSLMRVVSNRTGLTTTPANGGSLLSSMWSSGGLATFITSPNGTVTPMTVRTLAAKCVPSVQTYFVCGIPQNTIAETEGMPDDWYQGRGSFTDNLQLINTQTGEAYSLYTFDEKHGQIDATSLKTSQDGNLISLIQKQTGSLFLLNVSLLADGAREE